MSSEATNLDSYIPKAATQQTHFLQKYPEYDGRGIKIAILDSVIDVSCPGLQKTSTNQPKIIDCFDFTGNGSVNTSAIKEAENNILVGLSGRQLKIPSKWRNPSGKWHLGKTAYEILAFRTLCLNFTEDRKKLIESLNLSENLKDDEKNSKSVSSQTIVDCIVWFDGDKWRACIDTTFSKNLESLKILTNFHEENEFGYISEKKSCCVKILNNGNLLQIVHPFIEHGTLVSHIAASHFPDEEGRDGLAPGAQIISIEMNNEFSACKKAFLKCIEYQVDIINICRALPYSPELSKLLKWMVEKHGIIIIYAAGNSGPNYFSLKKDYHDFYENMFVIGSIFTREMKINLYKIEESEDDVDVPILYSHSSRGLTNNDSRGIDFVAPGAVAIKSFPQWHSTTNQIYHGTSVAAPCVTGSIACLLSALKANNIPYSPATIKLALRNTAFLPAQSDKIGFGNGIIQINDAFEYFKILPKIFSTKNLIPKKNFIRI